MTKSRLVIALGIIVVASTYLTTGMHFVAPGEVLVVRRLGRVLPHPWWPGPHLGGPIGIDRVTRLRTEEVRRLEVGLDHTPGPTDDPGAAEFLTGELNLIRAGAVVQYRVADPIAFVLRARDRDRLLPRLAEASLTSALARRSIDDTLLGGRAAVAQDAVKDLGQRASRYGLGIAVLGMSLTEARPPAEVQTDFAAAQAAQSEHDRRLTEARTYTETNRRAATAAAQARVHAAQARADRIVALARARAERFLALLSERERNPALTVRRAYWEALRELLGRVGRKVVMTADEPIDLSIFEKPR
jgi:membrane protease subunit HflK